MEGGGGDHLAGRACTGMGINDPKFATLPPHFDHSEEGGVLSDDEWNDIIPGYGSW